MTPATTTTTRRDVDDEVAADWRTLDADFGLSAARRRVVGRLRHDSGWDRTPPAPGLTPRSTDRGLQRPIASRSRVDGQYSPRCIYSTVAAVFRAPVHTTHEHGPSTRPVNTGSVYRARRWIRVTFFTQPNRTQQLTKANQPIVPKHGPAQRSRLQPSRPTLKHRHFGCSFYSAPQCSHCKRCISYSNSVCLSVCLSI